MAGTTKYQRALKVFNKYHDKRLNLVKIRSIILMELGGSANTIKDYMILLLNTGLLTDKYNDNYIINAKEAVL